MDLSIPVILGTARPSRQSEGVANAIVDLVKQRNLMTDLVDVRDYPLTGTGIPAPGTDLDGYRSIAAAADGFIIVAPEYNHGYPGELKLLLDTESQAYARKPVGLVTVSAGILGGARMAQSLRLVVSGLGMVPVAPALHVSEVGTAIDESGEFASPSMTEVAASVIDEVAWYARALKEARGA